MDIVDLIPAARALLKWSQGDLSRHSKVGVPAISDIENGRSRPQPQTLQKLTAALEQAGIEFQPGGVIKREDGLRVITGDDCYLRLLEEVHESGCSELLVWCADDRASSPAVNDKYRAMRRDGIRMRQLVAEGNTYLMGDLSEYRYLPRARFVNVVKLTYGDRHATVNGPESRVIIHRDTIAAESHRQIFNALWDLLPQPKRSTADETF